MLRHLEGQGQLIVAKACFRHKIKEHIVLTIIRKVHCMLQCIRPWPVMNGLNVLQKRVEHCSLTYF